ncbi:MAG: hypothetical protein U0271_34305 [Polyangiaceae bacterium]
MWRISSKACVPFAALLVACASPSGTSGSASASGTASAAPVAPKAELVTGELMTTLSKFPEPLVASTVSPATKGLVDGNVAFERELTGKRRFSPFHVFVCDGDCTLPFVEKLRGVAGAVRDEPFDLPDGRRGTVSGFSMFLGGGGVASVSKNGRYTLVVMMDLPPHDVEVEPDTRKFLDGADPREVVLAVHRGLDKTLF